MSGSRTYDGQQSGAFDKCDERPEPLCQIARETGKVPLSCLFDCPYKPSCGYRESVKDMPIVR